MEPNDRRGWRTLTDEQRAVAEDLLRRAEVLHAGANGELSMVEAVALAAVQIGHQRPAPEPAAAETPEFVKRCICGCLLGKPCSCDDRVDHGDPDGDPDFEPAQTVPELVELFRRPRVTPPADKSTP